MAFSDIDILDLPTDSLAMVTIMRNTTIEKNPDHKFVEYFNIIEITLRQQREQNQKLNAENAALRQRIDRLTMMGNNPEPVAQVEEITQSEINDSEWLRKPLKNNNFDQTPF